MGGGGTLTHRENVGAGAHVLPAESGQQLNKEKNVSYIICAILNINPKFCLKIRAQESRIQPPNNNTPLKIQTHTQRKERLMHGIHNKIHLLKRFD
jgi:hypothetical protein